MKLENQKVLLTGATGFIGGHVARRLLTEKSAAVRALVRNPAKAEDLARQGVELVPGDLGDVSALARAVRGCPVVIHTAAQVSSVPQREVFVQTNVAGTEYLLRAAAEAGVARFVHVSSIAAFGLPASGEIDDQTPRGPCGDSYCDTKFAAEEVVFRYGAERRLPVVILRPSSVYGPGSTHWSVIPLKRVKKGKMFLVGGGRGLLNYVYIDNLVDAIFLAVEDERAVGEAFIVNDGATTWQHFFGAYARMAGKDRIPSVPLWAARLWVHYRNLVAVIRRESSRVPPNALAFLIGSPVYRQTRIERTLGHRSRVNLEEGFRRTEAWFRETGLL
ncbi:MAG: NAD-dependent epimerase/dehydratase family protein [Acidobacteria bacterium]|nr:NAD-dependent epimerase/dehydratase family protein [Acidobacteriota bacterium]